MAPHSTESRLAAIEATLKHVDSTVATFAPTAVQVVEAQADAERALDAINDHKEWIAAVERRLSTQIKDVKTSCDGIRADYNAFLADRRKSRTTILVACLAASATVMAAIIAAVATILTSGG